MVHVMRMMDDMGWWVYGIGRSDLHPHFRMNLYNSVQPSPWTRYVLGVSILLLQVGQVPKYKDLSTAGQLRERSPLGPFVGRSGAVLFHFYKKMASEANQLLCFLLLLVANVMPVTGRR